MATAKQISLAQDLADQLNLDLDNVVYDMFKKDSIKECTIEEASDIIDFLIDERDLQREWGMIE